jgi:hypothetical protein
MKRSWNWALWTGFLVVLAGVLSFSFFAQFPGTRDFPWVNLLLFCVGGFLLSVGLARAFAQPDRYRGKIFGPILTTVSLLGVAFFAYGIFYLARQLPSSTSAPRVGQKAPDFTLPDQNGKEIALSALLSPSAGPNANGALLVFYRGFW